MKSKKLFTLLLLVSAMVFAVDVVQFTRSDFNIYTPSGDWREGTGQFWADAQIITLNVSAGSTVYLTSKVSNWDTSPYTDTDSIPNLGDADIKGVFYGFKMTEDNFGYMEAQRDAYGKITTDGKFHPGTTETTQVTYYQPNGSYTQTTTGYKLGTFDKDTEILFVMTPNGYDKRVDSYYPVNDPEFGYNTNLQSRHVNYKDLAENPVVNFGMVGNGGYGNEFVLGYVAAPPEPPSGQPLPGVLTSCLVALGATGIASRRRKQSRK